MALRKHRSMDRLATYRSITMSALIALAACKPPPTDADMARDMPEAEPAFASDPLPSPDTEGAAWVPTSQDRLIYGIPGQPALVALECLERDSVAPSVRITRLSPADEGAGALLALVGNGHIGRVAVDAREVNGRIVWQGEALASDLLWEPFKGPRALGVTVPGAGRVEINPSTLPGLFIEICGSPTGPEPDPLEIETPEEPVVISGLPVDDVYDGPVEPTTGEDALPVP